MLNFLRIKGPVAIPVVAAGVDEEVYANIIRAIYNPNQLFLSSVMNAIYFDARLIIGDEC